MKSVNNTFNLIFSNGLNVTLLVRVLFEEACENKMQSDLPDFLVFLTKILPRILVPREDFLACSFLVADFDLLSSTTWVLVERT